MTKSVDFETNLIRLRSIVVEVGAVGVIGGTAGLVLAMRVQAGVFGLRMMVLVLVSIVGIHDDW